MATRFRVGQRVIVEHPTEPRTGTIYGRQIEIPQMTIGFGSEITCEKYVTVWSEAGSDDVMIDDVSIIDEELI